MTKNEIINDTVFELRDTLTKEQLDRVRITLLVKMQDYEVREMTMLPAVVEHDNDWILKRFLIDGIAKGTRESSLKAYIGAASQLLKATGKNYRQITGQDITDYLALRQYRDGISINYKSTLCRYLFVFFGWAYRKHHIQEDIMRDVDRVKPRQKRVERLTDEEIEEIREVAITPKEKAILELMLSTGMRVGEMVLLNRDSIDLEHRRIIIYGQKSDKYRTGILSTRAARALREYLKTRNDDSQALFASSRKPYGRMQKAGFEGIAKTLALRAGITRLPATVHAYRKTFASILYKKTKDILMVSKLLGHANTTVTVKYYLVDDIEDMQYTYNIVVN